VNNEELINTYIKYLNDNMICSRKNADLFYADLIELCEFFCDNSLLNITGEEFEQYRAKVCEENTIQDIVRKQGVITKFYSLLKEKNIIQDDFCTKYKYFRGVKMIYEWQNISYSLELIRDIHTYELSNKYIAHRVGTTVEDIDVVVTFYYEYDDKKVLGSLQELQISLYGVVTSFYFKDGKYVADLPNEEDSSMSLEEVESILNECKLPISVDNPLESLLFDYKCDVENWKSEEIKQIVKRSF